MSHKGWVLGFRPPKYKLTIEFLNMEVFIMLLFKIIIFYLIQVVSTQGAKYGVQKQIQKYQHTVKI